MEHLSWIGLGLLAASGAAGVSIFGKLGVAQLDTTLAATLRSLVMRAALCAVVLLSGRLHSLRRDQREGWGPHPGRNAALAAQLRGALGASRPFLESNPHPHGSHLGFEEVLV